MTDAREQGKVQSAGTVVADASTASDPVESPGTASESSKSEYPRIVEEHGFVDAYGQEDIEATDDRGRRWYHLRPQPPGRADVLGFGFMWWAFLILLIIVFLPWGWWY